jgi:hypothetical protein
MTDQVHPFQPEDQAGDDRPTATGVPSVDRVLTDIDTLDDLPLEEHLGAFERAHDSLREALDVEPDDPA